MSRDHFDKNRKLLTNWRPIHVWNDRPLQFTKKIGEKTSF